MNADTLVALQGSIAKWEAITAGTGEDNGDENCTLCQRFNGNDSEMNCRTPDGDVCPVDIASGTPHCCKTPYTTWQHHLWDSHGLTTFPYKVMGQCCVPFAHAELNFLKSLLPKDAPDADNV